MGFDFIVVGEGTVFHGGHSSIACMQTSPISFASRVEEIGDVCMQANSSLDQKLQPIIIS